MGGALAVVLGWAGYTILYYGITQVRGGNWGLLDLAIPGRWARAAATPTDAGTTGGVNGDSAAAAAPANATGPASPSPQPSTINGKPNPTGANTPWIFMPGTGNADLVPPPKGLGAV